MFSKLRNMFSRHKKSVSVAFFSAIMACLSCFSAFATDDTTSSSMQQQFSTAIGGIQSDLMGYIMLVVPVALAILGAVFGIKKAIAFFKSMANKAG